MKTLKDLLVCLLLVACSAFFSSLVVLGRNAETTVRSVRRPELYLGSTAPLPRIRILDEST